MALIPSPSLAAVGRVALLVNGVALACSIAIRTASAEQIVRWTALLTYLGAGALPLMSIFLVEWPSDKNVVGEWAEPLLSRAPQLLPGVIAGTTRGGVHPNELAGVLVLLLPSAFQILIASPKTRPLSALTLVLGSAALVLTQSRSGYMGVMAAFLLLAARYLLQHRGKGRASTLAAVGAAIVAVPAFFVLARLVLTWTGSGTGESGLDSFASRLELWQHAVLLASAMTLTGVGIGQFSTALHTLTPPVLTPPGVLIVHAHNGYLQAVMDLGIFGGIGAVGLLAASAMELLWVSRQANKEFGAISYGLAMGLLGFGVFSLTDAIAFPARGALPIWIIVGLAGAAGRSYRPTASK